MCPECGSNDTKRIVVWVDKDHPEKGKKVYFECQTCGHVW